MITPRVALTPESSERPMVRASVPGAGAVVVRPGACVPTSILRTARSVPGSVPASAAGTVAPSGRVTVISSSRRTVCSAVTIAPGRQNTPLDENRGRACTATTLRPASSTAVAISLERAASSFGMCVSPVITGSRGTGRHDIGRSGRCGLPNRAAVVARVSLSSGNCYTIATDSARRHSTNGRIIGSVHGGRMEHRAFAFVIVAAALGAGVAPAQLPGPGVVAQATEALAQENAVVLSGAVMLNDSPPPGR